MAPFRMSAIPAQRVEAEILLVCHKMPPETRLRITVHHADGCPSQDGAAFFPQWTAVRPGALVSAGCTCLLLDVTFDAVSGTDSTFPR